MSDDRPFSMALLLAPRGGARQSSVRRRTADAASSGHRELVLDAHLDDHRIARPGDAEPGPDDELEATREPPVDDREDVVLLLTRSVDRADLADAAEELDPGEEIAR